MQVFITLACAVFYIATAQRGPSWQDSGIHQLRALGCQFDNPLGLALAHPLLIALAQPLKCIFGTANLATAMNMLSSVAMAVAVGNVFRLGILLKNSLFAATLAATALAVAHTPWWLATITESYALVAMFLSFELLILHKLITSESGRAKKLCLLAGICGLHWSLHNFALLSIPVYTLITAILIKNRKLKPIAPLLAAICFLGGATLQIWLIFSHLGAGESFSAVLNSALFGNSWQGNVLGANLGSIAKSAIYILLNFPFVSWLVILTGLVCISKNILSKHTNPQHKLFQRALLAIITILLLFAIRYNVPDQFMFLLPAYVPLSAVMATGIDFLIRLKGPKTATAVKIILLCSVILTPLLYISAAGALSAAEKSIRPGRQIPYRSENLYWLLPAKHFDRSAERLATEVLENLPDSGIVTADNTIAPPLRYMQLAEGIKSDVKIIWADTQQCTISSIDANQWLKILNGKDLYIVETMPPAIRKDLYEHCEQTETDILVKLPYRQIKLLADENADK